MRDNTIETFFALVRAGLFPVHGEGVMVHDSLFKDVDWNEVYQMAQEQSVQGLVLAGIDSFRFHVPSFKMPQMLLLQWIGEVQIIEQQNKEMNAFIADLIEKLRKYDIYAILVKGQGIAQCYDKPLWRSSGDVDLLLSDKNYYKAKELLLPLGELTEPEEAAKRHLAMQIGQWIVELHGTLHVGLSARVDRMLDNVQYDIFHRGDVRSWVNGNTQVFLPAANEDVVYVFAHILQHFYKGGIGLRQICDWCRLLWTYKDSLNQKLLESRIRKMGLMSEWRAFGAFAVEYLGMPKEAMPLYSADEKWKKKADKICAFILEEGNMGHNRGSWLMEHDSWFARRYVVRKAFSMFRRIGDLINHARIFPLDSLRFFPYIVFNVTVR